MKKLALIVLLLFTFISCNDDNDQEILPLIITSYSPESGNIGDEVILVGENIDTNINYLLKINDLVLDDIAVNETTLTGKIPSGAISGELSVDYNETIINVGMFDVDEQLLITSYSPESGLVGEEVELLAENLNLNLSYTIKINDLVLDDIAITVSGTKLTGKIPSGATSGNLSVEYNEISLLVGPFEVEEPLQVTSYSPTSGYEGDEFIIQAENIDTSTNYIIKVNGLVASSVSVNETELKGRIPTGASTGYITIEYANVDLNVGPFEVLESTDELYICNFPDFVGQCHPLLYKIDLSSGVILENPWNFTYGCDEVTGGTMYNPRSNTLWSSYFYGGGTWGYYKANVLNINNGIQNNYVLSGYEVFESFIYTRFGSIGDENMYYNEYFQDIVTGEYYTNLIARNLDTQAETILFNSSINIGHTSLFVPSLNNYIGYYFDDSIQEYFFFKADITNQTYTTSQVNNHIQQTIITSEEVVYGLNVLNSDTYQIVQIDPNTGEIILIIDEVNEKLKNLNYSESSNRFYVGYADQNPSLMNKIYIYSLNTGSSSIMTLNDDLTFYALMLKY